tara:strand:- start:140 stop:634 length:495 start_codon:yes stop_codon:yes gene_type:complete
MFELLGGGIFGSLLGGVFRLVPEFLKAFDKKNERSHELSMFDKQCDVEKTRGAQKLSEISAERDSVLDTGAMAAFQSSIQQQTDMVKAAGGWAASLSASVRPVMTYYLLVVYGVVKICLAISQMRAGVPFVDVMPKLWSMDDMALLSGVVNYWILDRTLAKRGI